MTKRRLPSLPEVTELRGGGHTRTRGCLGWSCFLHTRRPGSSCPTPAPTASLEDSASSPGFARG